MEEVMRLVKEKMDLREYFWYKLYADDLVVVVPQRYIVKVLLTLTDISEDFNLIIN